MIRRAHDANLPQGSAWNPERGGGMDLFFEGAAESFGEVRDDLRSLADIRSPLTTPVLTELEAEFGIVPNDALTEAERRGALQAKIVPQRNRGQAWVLQQALDAAGFGLLVHENSPAVDPAGFLAPFYTAVAGNQAACCGNQEAQASNFPAGEMIVNGDVWITTKNFTTVCGAQAACCGNRAAQAGGFSGLTRSLREWPAPTAAAAWPLVFFVGGAATRDGTGALLTIARGSVPVARRSQLVEIITRIKPAHSWCALIARFD